MKQEVITLEKIKTTTKALNRIIELYLNDTNNNNVLTYISHAHNDEAVEYITNEIHKVHPERKNY